MNARRLRFAALFTSLLAATVASADLRSTADAAWQAQNWAEAAAAYEKVVAEKADDADAWYRLGYAWHVQGQFEKALAAHLKAASFTSPQQPAAAYNAACAYSLLKRKDEAFDALKKAAALGFSDAKLLDTDTDLASLRDDPRFAEIKQQIAKSKPAAASPGASPNAVQRQFDFWVGDWDVFNPAGQKVGENRIDKLQGGFIIMENWTDAGGKTGMSMNYVDYRDGKWKQIWMSDQGWSVHKSGEFRDGAMRLEGDSCFPNGKCVRIRTAWTPLDDGRVRQFIETSNDDGKTWTAGFDGYYVRKSTDQAK